MGEVEIVGFAIDGVWFIVGDKDGSGVLDLAGGLGGKAHFEFGIANHIFGAGEWNVVIEGIKPIFFNHVGWIVRTGVETKEGGSADFAAPVFETFPILAETCELFGDGRGFKGLTGSNFFAVGDLNNIAFVERLPGAFPDYFAAVGPIAEAEVSDGAFGTNASFVEERLNDLGKSSEENDLLFTIKAIEKREEDVVDEPVVSVVFGEDGEEESELNRCWDKRADGINLNAAAEGVTNEVDEGFTTLVHKKFGEVADCTVGVLEKAGKEP